MLSIEAGLEQIPILARTILTRPARVPWVLQSLHLSISPSYEPRLRLVTAKAEATAALTQLIAHFDETLIDLSLDCRDIDYDHSVLLKNLGVIPNLRKFKINPVQSHEPFSGRPPLAQFLAKNRSTLQHIILRSPPVHRYSEPDAVQTWLTQEHDFHIVLPNVTILEIGLSLVRCNHWGNEDATTRKLPSPPMLAPHILPKLRSLTIQRSPSLPEIHVMNATFLVGGALEELNIWVDMLQARVIQLLAKNCPNLQRLTLGYAIFAPLDRPSTTHGQGRVDDELFSDDETRDIMSRWPLEYLRIGLQLKATCGIHPSRRVSIAVEEMIGRYIEKDNEVRCFCMPKFKPIFPGIPR